MFNSAKFAAVVAWILISAVAASAADSTTTVKFKVGSTSTTVKGNLKGYDGNTYVLGASSGQTLTVSFKPSNASCYFNINGPTGEEALFNGSMSADGSYSGKLVEDGDYKAVVYLMRNAARRNETCRYTITFSIRN